MAGRRQKVAAAAPAIVPIDPAPLAAHTCPELAAWNARWATCQAPRPLVISCRVPQAICIPDGHLALDGLLAAAVVMATGQPPALTPQDCARVEIPVAREPEGRFHLASFAIYDVERRGRGYTNQRFPLQEAQEMGDERLRRITITTGPCKSYRIPREHAFVADSAIRWYALGDADAILELLSVIRYLGKRRAVGLGKVVPGSWRADPIEPWPGFPVLGRDGEALRPLPMDWPWLGEHEPAYRTLTYPYHDRAAEEFCAGPVARW